MLQTKFEKMMASAIAVVLSMISLSANAEIEGSLDPKSVVAEWSNASPCQKIIDINFSDEIWPGQTWKGETGRDCPEWASGGYVNTIVRVPANGGTGVKYPVLFHNCMFANKKSFNGFAGATAAFCRQYYLGEKATGNSVTTYNNWTVAGHKKYIEDNIKYNEKGTPTYGEAGFVQFCRDAGYTDDATQAMVSRHGWMEIDHIPYVERIQWAWSGTAWGRGIKCDVKIGDGDWKPLVWLGSNKQKNGYTVFSDQGYFMENIIDAHDVSLRWRVWDGDDNSTHIQTKEDGTSVFNTQVNPMAQHQAARVHKLQIFGDAITATDAKYAEENPVGDVGELSDLGGETPDEGDKGDESVTLKAFPTAEGFGKYATGGRGGKVVTVTSLNDDASEGGTLRWAFNQYKGEPITIVFAVSGEIKLGSELRVNRADWTMAGQTAPGEGVVISRNKINLGGSQNFIVRNVRFRSGAKDVNGNVLTDQACGVENCRNFIFDHCSFGWSVEENMNTQDSHFLTVQYCMVHEGLYKAGHSKGERGYGVQWGGSPATYHHNLLAHNKSRSPRINGARGDDYVVFMEYVNNVNYNPGGSGAAYGGENTADISQYNGENSVHECNFMNNYYKRGKAYTSTIYLMNSSYARSGATSWAPSKWYVNGNIIEGDANANQDNWNAMKAEIYSLDQIRANERIVTKTPFTKYSVTGGRDSYEPELYMLQNIQTAEQAYSDVLANAGCVNRDRVEKRIATEARNGTCTYGGKSFGAGKGILDSEEDCEGFYAYRTDYTVPVDTDGDGMPDEWEQKHGLNPNVADNNTVNKEGYTVLEVYLNSLMGEKMNEEFATSIDNITIKSAEMTYDGDTNTLIVSPEAVGSKLQVFSTDGSLLHSQSITSASTTLNTLPSGVLIMQLRGNKITPRSIKVVK